MPKSGDGTLNDEAVHLFQKGLYVEPLNYPIDPEKFPADGHEYIHRVRLEEAAIFSEMDRDFSQCMPMLPKEDKADTTVDNKVKMSLSEWKRKEASSFCDVAIKLKLHRELLMKEFPSQQFPPVKNEKEFCLFCLGSELYKKIFSDEQVDDTSEHVPLLSIVLHLSQEEILTALEYFSEWTNHVKMDHVVCRWIYALLACLRKPVSDDCEEFLEDFYDKCVIKCKNCDQVEKNQLHLVTAILKNYFCVKAHKVGPTLDKFLPLC